ncbi:uncharacterized protein LOC143914029 [Arctopsyche grandis]|uniref:uncharacterized protein LOC143914029 n=1 Tax=Arctopsyche grandis TaxID=121162 RepID=UPI00406D9DAA
MHPFLNNYTNQNQGYYVFIHEENSPADVPTEFPAPSGTEGLEWDEEVVESNLTEREDDDWASLYRWYAQMLEQTEGLVGTSEASLKATIDKFAKKQRGAAHYAAEQGHVGVLRLLLQTNAKVDSCDSDGLTPLHLAAKFGQTAALKVLLEAGADPNRCTLNPDQTTALHIAAAFGHINIIGILISTGALLEIRDGAERTPLQVAVQEGRIDAVVQLLQAGSNVNVEDVHGNTPLCEAIFQDAIRIVESLLSSGARIQPHHCLLHYAVLHKQMEIVQYLLRYGSNVNLRDCDGDTPLLLACRSGQIEVVRLLLENGGSVDYPNSLTGSTALHETVSCSRDVKIFQEIFFCLQDYHVNLNTICFTGGDTPLFRAIILERDEIAKLLIKHGADVNLCSLQHCVVDNLSLALAQRNVSVARLLVLAGASPPSNWERIPRPLTHLTRLVLRAHLPAKSIFRSIQALPLPVALKDFLMFKNED